MKPKKKGYRVVLPNEDPLFVAEAVAGSPLVVTSSLHGLVFADAYGIPAQLVSFRAKTEPDLKFHDYSSVFGEVPHFMPVVDALSIPVTGMIDRVESRTRNVAVTLPGVIDGIHGVAAHSLQFLSEDL